MKRDLPVQKNEDLTLTVENMTVEGQGVAHKDGFAVFIPGALNGETVRAHVIKTAASYAVAKPLEILTPSPARVTPPCPAYPACGGCTLLHMDYAAELSAKRQAVEDALVRLGGFSGAAVPPVRGMEHPFRYRNKGSFPFAEQNGRAVSGFYAARSHRLIPLSDCLIEDEGVTDVVRRVSEWAETFRVSAYDESSGRGVLRHVAARVSSTGERMAVIVTTGPLPHRAELLELLADVDSVWQNVNAAATNVIFGEKFTHLAGSASIGEQIGGLRFSVGPRSFLQVNAAQTAVLYGYAIEFLAATPNETVVDAYCGIGTLSLLAAQTAGSVLGVESVPEAVEDAKHNAVQNRIGNAAFLLGKCEDVLPKLVSDGTQIDAVMLDPPRKGCEAAALSAIAESGAKRVVYVSCNPATLARDLKALAARGYALTRVQPVDMFPHTGHVETVVLMTRA